MEINEDNYYAVLKPKHERLVKALDRVDVLLNKYAKDLGCCWSNAHDWDYNLLYDLRDRLENRIHANYMIIGDWNWKVHGLNIIDVR